MNDISLTEWREKLDRCKTPADVHELNAGRSLLEKWGLVSYPTEHRQAAATRSAEVTRAAGR